MIEIDADEHWAEVSPDGTMLAYQSDADGVTGIWVKDISAWNTGYDPTDPGTNLTADSPSAMRRPVARRHTDRLPLQPQATSTSS